MTGVRRERELDGVGDRPLWRNVSFQLTWSSTAASGFADRLTQLAAWPLLGINAPGVQAASVQAGVLFFFLLPYVLIGPIGGWLADRLPRKWLMLFADEMRGLVLLGAIGALSYYSPNYAGQAIAADHPLAHVARFCTYGTVFLTGVMAAIFSPTRDALVPEIVPVRQLQSANALILAIATIAALVGLGVGGWMIQTWSVRRAMVVAMLCYLVTGTFWAFLKPRRVRRERSLKVGWGQFREVWSYLRGHRRVVELYGMSLLFWGLGSVALAAMAALCKGRYGVSEEELVSRIGWMQAGLGAGMLISSLALAALGELRGASRRMVISLMACGACVLGIWWLPWYGVGLVLVVVLGFFANVVRVSTDTLTQALSANWIRGRVFGVREILATGSTVLVNALIWQMEGADAWMVQVLPGLGVVLIAVGGWGWWRGRRKTGVVGCGEAAAG